MSISFTGSDAGKPLVTPDGAVIGRVQEIRAGDAYVQPKQGLFEACGFWFGNPLRSSECFALDSHRVQSIEDDRIVVAADTEPSPPVSWQGEFE